MRGRGHGFHKRGPLREGTQSDGEWKGDSETGKGTERRGRKLKLVKGIEVRGREQSVPGAL